MAVPDTTTFTLQDVVNEVNPTTDDLVDCFADANASDFDVVYEGSKDELLNFRNYNGTVEGEFFLSKQYVDEDSACGQAANDIKYHNNITGNLPKVTSIVYENVGQTVTYDGGGKWHSMGSSTNIIEISSVGVVTALFECGGAPL